MTVGEERPEDAPRPADEHADHTSRPDTASGLEDADGHVELLPSSEPSRTVMRAVGLVEQVIGGSLILVILVLVLTQVAQRYIHAFGGWPWTGEVARLAMVWCSFALTGYLMAQDRHITIKVIDLVLPDRAVAVSKLVAHMVVVVTCLGMGYATYRLIADDIGQRTPAAGIPLALVYVMILVGYCLTALRAAMAIGLADLRELRRPQETSA